jgi:hypothetical protein
MHCAGGHRDDEPWPASAHDTFTEAVAQRQPDEALDH